jgi:hypothetical protein
MACSPPPGPDDFYDATILHEPPNNDLNGPATRAKSFLSRRLRLSLKDQQVLFGTFSAYDTFGNIVLTKAEETFGN